ncbi:hypothetical protein F4777DRAFT_532389 [Nemania sp. FL0916]|nr:hypothetical protein F4777DRAFT_532389 [Nemania sp. FL0916]
MLPNLIRSSHAASWILVCAILLIVSLFYLAYQNRQTEDPITPPSADNSFTGKCNRECAFCCWADKTSHVASEEEMRHVLRQIKMGRRELAKRTRT